MSNLNNFHSLEVVDRVSETQLQVVENSDSQWRQQKPFWLATRWKKCYVSPPPPYFITLDF